MKLYPLKFKPIYKKRIWGGQKLRTFFGKDLPRAEKIGESWELADLPDDKSAISNGELAGMTLNKAVRKYPKEITGDENFKLPFPLLIKFLDAEDILSVQVHPDTETCRRTGKGDPKTECWYIIDAIRGGFIYKGLKPGVTKEKFAAAIGRGTVEDLLQKVPVSPGECHFLPSGTAHSIGPGLLIAEIQTPSDTTYRVYDFNRVNGTGKPRQLHIEEALESIHFGRAYELSVTTIGRLIECEYFTVDKGHQATDYELLLSAGEMKTLIMLTGAGTIFGRDGSSVGFRQGDCIVVPFSYEGAINFGRDTQYLTITL